MARVKTDTTSEASENATFESAVYTRAPKEEPAPVQFEPADYNTKWHTFAYEDGQLVVRRRADSEVVLSIATTDVAQRIAEFLNTGA